MFDSGAVEWTAVGCVIERLLEYAELHFADEEALMHSVGVDRRHVEPHEREHRQFIQQVRSMWEMRASLRQPNESIMAFLTSWLSLHILGVDQAMARQAKLIGSGGGSEEAFELEEQADDKGTRALLKTVGKLYGVLAQQNSELLLAKQRVEQRVARRTAQLALVNNELRLANERLEAFSRTDGLLQIPNRSCFDARMKIEAASACRHRRSLAILMLDVDCFKQYNDTYGHLAGDACLQAIARAVQRSLGRETDFLGRYGGEELIVMLPETDNDGAWHVAERMLQSVRRLALPHATSFASPIVTLSIGVCSEIPTSLESAAQLIANADAALYTAKRGGRNRAVLSTKAGTEEECGPIATNSCSANEMASLDSDDSRVQMVSFGGLR